MTFKSFWHNCGIEMRGCWKGPISPSHAARGNSGRRRFFECLARVMEPLSVPGVDGVKKFTVAPESNITKAVCLTVILEVASLHLNVKLFNVCSGHQHRQRPTSARCFSDPPMMLVWVACSL